MFLRGVLQHLVHLVPQHDLRVQIRRELEVPSADERMRLLLVAIAIFHIKEAPEMTEAGNETSFYFCLGITLECALTIIGRIELMLQGDARMRNDSAAVLCIVFVPRLVLYTAAWLSQSHYREWPVLVLCGSLIPSVLAVAGEYFITMVPIDQHKYNERIGAWVCVLLGEGVISLLKENIDTSSGERWITVIIVLMTLMVLHSIYFHKQGSVQDSDKFRGWLQSGSIQALSIGVIGIGVFAANGPKFELLSRNFPEAQKSGFDFGSYITEKCDYYLSGGKSRTALCHKQASYILVLSVLRRQEHNPDNLPRLYQAAIPRCLFQLSRHYSSFARTGVLDRKSNSNQDDENSVW